MGFAERHLHALCSSNLKDDAFNFQPEALQASAHADKVARNIGSLLSRVKNANCYRREHEGDTHALAALLREWQRIVTEKGTARRWVKAEDVAIAPILYRRVAEASLSFYLDGNCGECSGAGVTQERSICKPCKGSGRGEIVGVSGYERNLILDMLSELGAIDLTHSRTASALMRREL